MKKQKEYMLNYGKQIYSKFEKGERKQSTQEFNFKKWLEAPPPTEEQREEYKKQLLSTPLAKETLQDEDFINIDYTEPVREYLKNISIKELIKILDKRTSEGKALVEKMSKCKDMTTKEAMEYLNKIANPENKKK